MSEGADGLRARLLQRVAPVLTDAGLAGLVGDVQPGALDWSGWDDAARRAGGSLDEETAARARGDKNRALLMD